MTDESNRRTAAAATIKHDPSFLGIPTELRLMIYEHLFPKPKPATYIWGGRELCPRSTLVPNEHQLGLVRRKIWDETEPSRLKHNNVVIECHTSMLDDPINYAGAVTKLIEKYGERRTVSFGSITLKANRHFHHDDVTDPFQPAMEQLEVMVNKYAKLKLNVEITCNFYGLTGRGIDPVCLTMNMQDPKKSAVNMTFELDSLLKERRRDEKVLRKLRDYATRIAYFSSCTCRVVASEGASSIETEGRDLPHKCCFPLRVQDGKDIHCGQHFASWRELARHSLDEHGLDEPATAGGV